MSLYYFLQVTVFGKTISYSTIKAQAQVAMPILEVLSNSDLKITDKQTEGECNFSIRNYNEKGKITEVGLQYIVSIKDTIDSKQKETITYELYKNGQKIELNNQATQKMILGKDKKQDDQYTLKIKYDKDKSTEMGNILDAVQIQVHSEQEQKI